MSDVTRRIADLSPEKLKLLVREKHKKSQAIRPQRRASTSFPLSFAQQRLWFLDQFEAGSSQYTMAVALRLRGILQVRMLERALSEIVRRHEALRTAFAVVVRAFCDSREEGYLGIESSDGQPMQVVAPPMPIMLPVVNLSGISQPLRGALSEQLIQEGVRRPFDLTQPPLLRADLLRLQPEEHVLLLTLHHIVSDAWSMGLLVRELSTLYQAFVLGQFSPLADLPLQYVDYTLWQRNWLQGEILEKHLAYWKQHLQAAPTHLELPTDRPRPAVQTFRGARHILRLPLALREELKELGRRERVTLFMTLLAAFAILLARHSNQYDLVIGTPIANRRHSELENLIGCFVNTLVLRIDLSGNPSVRELLAGVREVCLEGYAHQDLPFEKLVEVLQPGRELSHTPLFQVMFNLQNAADPPLELAGLQIEVPGLESGTAKFDLDLSVQETADGLIGVLEYNTDLFEAATMARMAGHWQTLLEGMVADPQQPLSQLPLLTVAEREQLLVEWNQTSTVLPVEQCLHHLFEAQVERTPDAIAVVYEDEQLSYQELNLRANQLAHYLHKLGVGPEVPVGICVERSLEMLVGLLGILKAGGAYVPLDPAYPEERLAFMLTDARLSVVLTQQRLTGSLRASGAQIVCLDSDWQLIPQQDAEQQASAVTALNLAYIMYTSGSTGRPKGVACPHRGVVNFLADFQHRAPIAQGDGCSLWCSFSFDVSVYELFSAFLAGGTVHLVPEYVRAEGRRCIEWLQARQIRSAYLPPFMLGDLRNSLHQKDITLVLQRLLVGVEPIPQQLLIDLNILLPTLQIVNGYGPTETTICSTLYDVRVQDVDWGNASIGRPVENTHIYLLDAQLQPVPVGVAGELYIGGVGLTRGYFHQPDLTAERFIPDPFNLTGGGSTSGTTGDHKGPPGHSPPPSPLRDRDSPARMESPGGTRLYKTGDLARYRSNGYIEFLGRRDGQVKIRGYRIERGEIEVVLSRHPAIREVVVVAREDEPGDKRLVAYLVPYPGQKPTASDVRSYLQAKLPSYMVPSAFMLLEALPLTPNGKLDRRALPLPGPRRPDVEELYVTPRTPIEEILVDIWADMLRLEQVGIHDNFFELGGHSLLATQLVSRVRETLQVDVPLSALFAVPTVVGLAEHIATAYQARQGLRVPPLYRFARVGNLPLSFAQQRLWVLDQLEPANASYNIPLAARLKGLLHLAVLEQSLSEIIHRHEALRTIFTDVAGQPVQIILPPWKIELPLVDLREICEPERESAVQRLVTAEAQRPFDLASGPLIRASVLRLGVQEHVLLLTMHHIISDGWSMGVLGRELSMLYEAFMVGKPSPLPELPIQYVDYTLWQREHLQGAVFEEQLVYWRQQLQGCPPVLDLRPDQPRPPVQTFRGAYIPLLLPRELSEALKALSRQQKATLFMTLLAVFKILLARFTGQDDIVVGTPVAGRVRSEIEPLIGFFLNTLVLRTDLSGQLSFLDVLQRVRKVTVDAYAHQDVPFEHLLQVLQVERSLSYTPLFQVFFNMLNLPNTVRPLPGLSVEMVLPAEIASKFDLILNVKEQQGTLLLELMYNVDLFEQRRMVEMLAQLHTLLRQIVEHPEEDITRFSLVTAAARAVLPDPTAVLDADWYGAIHTQFSWHARRVPDRIAVVDAEGAWSYQELDRRSNQLAHALRAHGIQPQDRVAIYGARNAALTCAVLGVLKAGAVYSVLDPAYPVARLMSYIELMRPQGWVQIEEAGALPGLLEEYLEVGRRGVMNPPRICLTLSAQMVAMARHSLGEPAPETLAVSVGPDDAACITFTSGSTGTPKGVIGRHGPLTHFLPWQAQVFGLYEDDHFTLLSGLAHDSLQRDIFTPFWFGVTLYIPTPEEIVSPGRLASWMDQQQVSVTHVTPAMIHLLTHFGSELEDAVTAAHEQRPSPGQLPMEDAVTAAHEQRPSPGHLPTAVSKGVPSLRLALILGDAVTRDDVVRLRQVAPAITSVNIYGATETQRALGYFIVPDTFAQEHAREMIPLGRGMKDVQLLVLHHGLQLAGVAEVGEIYMRSPHLARGYLDDEALTRERFLLNPFTCAQGDRLYKTGDLGCYLPDGTVEFLGRCDNQVNLRGFRIETEEIEAVLKHHAAVQDCLVMLREDRPGDRRLVAYIVPQEQQKPVVSDMRSYVQARLPDYMLPSVFMLLERLPLTPNRKIDRRALPAPDWNRPELKESFVAARTPIEEVLVALWTQTLHLSAIGIYDNFFELGGHSLLATRVIARVRETLRVEIPLRMLFEAPTIADLAERIEQAMQAERGLQRPPLHPCPREGDLPLAFAQQRLWFLDRFEPGSSLYNMPVALRMQGTLNVAALERSFNEIIQRHEALRTTFAVVEGSPVQRINPTLQLRVPIVDVHGLQESVREAQVRRIMTEEVAAPFDLDHGPLLRVYVLRLDLEEHVVLLNMHHIISDAWSMGVLLRELATLYQAYVGLSKPSPLPELPLQYVDYALWQRAWLRGEVLQTQLGYWQEQLRGAPMVLTLPTDRSRPAILSSRGAQHVFSLPRALSESLTTLSRQEGVTLFMTLLAAWQTLLFRYSGQDDLLVGTPIANRTHQQLEDLVGFFVNTLVLRTNLSGDPGFRDLLRRVREVCLGAYAHQDVPFEQLVEAIQPQRDLSHTPLFQVMFVLQNVPLETIELPGLRLQSLALERTTARFELTLTMQETARGLLAVLEYNSDLFEAATIERMAAHFRQLLESIVADPLQPLSRLSLLTEAERELLLVEWNATQQEYPREQCLHQLIEAQVERSPEAIALVYEHEHLTYHELNRRANQLAHYLRQCGVGPDVLVGLCLERSLDLVVAMLAILKAGGAYVPLDPHYPPERLAFLLQDARVEVLLTQQSCLQALSAQNTRSVCLDVEWSRIARADEQNPACHARPQNLVYVIYTSGSTGRPKGVMIEHHNAVSLVSWAGASFAREQLAGVLASTSICFDLSIFEVFVPLCWGGTVLLIEQLLDLPNLPAAQRVTLLNTVPSVLAEMLRTEPPPLEDALATVAARGRPLQHLPTSARTINLAGEPVPANLISQVYGQETVEQLFNLYGPTEDTTYSTWALLERDGEGPVIIGRSLSNKQAYLLDASLQPVPVGVVGELYLGGEGLARGYLNSALLTAERFVPHPWSRQPGARLYRTGDLARYLADGTIEYIGRSDDQIKLHGYRIEPGEIEVTLRQHAGVREAVVLVRADIPGDKRLVAYIVPNAGQRPVVSDLRGYVQQKLPSYMVPSAFVVLESLPLSPHGKIDRRALPRPEELHLALKSSYVAPQTRLERTIAAIWKEILHIEHVGIDDNFFDLGGHSLLLIQVQSRLQAVVEERVAITDLFQYPTIASLAQYVQQRQPAEAAFQESFERAEKRRLAMRRQRQEAQRLREQEREGAGDE